MASLVSAHKGYQYQDLSTAVAMTELLVAGRGRIAVDKKHFENDILDDITVISDRVERRQLKWTKNPDRRLRLGDLKWPSSPVSIQKLLATYFGSIRRFGSLARLRLAACWRAPEDEELLAVLEAADTPPSVPGSTSIRFKLRAEHLWPVGAKPAWGTITCPSRDEFLDFVDRFTIELELPGFSRDLRQPGALESTLLHLLTDRVGIGVYPNANRDPVDVAARLIQRATSARAASEEMSVDDIARDIALRRDFGSVAQHFPVQDDRYVSRSLVHREILTSLEEHSASAIVGPPGSGKSWSLSTLSSSLPPGRYIAAYHYCYVDPDDGDARHRITIDVLYGNLISGLLAAEPSLIEGKQQRYASDAQELQRVLLEAESKFPNRLILLVVDGLDHIERVAADAPEVSRAATGIVDSLSGILWPKNARLVVGSQPGEHLRPLLPGARVITMPPLERSQLVELATLHGLVHLLERSGEATREALEVLADRAEGNPLYATVLMRGASDAAGQGILPTRYLQSVPPLAGDIANYYGYLFDSLDGAGQIVATHLGLLDFSVSLDELAELSAFPTRTQVSKALAPLKPLLKNLVGQAGLRIFHESFRRFITERLDKAERLSNFERLCRWLRHLGQFRDRRAYQFLPIYLGRTGRHVELFDMLDGSFIARSIAHGYVRQDVLKVLHHAVALAGQQQSLAALAKLTFLVRACETVYQERLDDSTEPYWRTFLAIHGPEAAASRLVVDGHPVATASSGLQVCSAVDDAGVSAPWSTYMDLYEQESQDRTRSEPESPRERGLRDAAFIHGIARLDGLERATQVLAQHLKSQSGAHPHYLGVVVDRWLDFDPHGLSDFVTKTDAPCALRRHIARAALQSTRLGVGVAREAIASFLVHRASDPSDWTTCHRMRLTQDLERTGPSLPLEDVPTGRPHHDREILQWLNSITWASIRDPLAMEAVRERLRAKPGWYWAWLMFCTHLVQAEEEAFQGQEGPASARIVAQLEELSFHATPFTGSPRACDLTGIWDTIRNTLSRALDCTTDEHFSKAAQYVLDSAKGTRSHLHNYSGGPIPWWSYCLLMEPYSKSSARSEVALRMAQRCRQLSLSAGQLYHLDADELMTLARMCAYSGKRDEALKLWTAISRTLASYGFRREQTIFDLIYTVNAVATEATGALALLERLSPLLTAVVHHTDTKDTRHAPGAAVGELAEASPSAAAQYICECYDSRANIGWVERYALRRVLWELQDKASPYLVTLLMCATAEPTSSDDNKPVVDGLRSALGLLSEDAEGTNLGPLIDLLEARVSFKDSSREMQFLCEASRMMWADGPGALGLVPEATSARPAQRRKSGQLRVPTPVGHEPLLEAIGWLRRTVHDETFFREPVSIENRIGYYVESLASRARHDEAQRFLEAVSDSLPRWEGRCSGLLANIGQGLQLRGLRTLASSALAMSFATARGNGGYWAIGDADDLALLEHAESINSEVAHRVVTQSVADSILRGDLAGLTSFCLGRIAKSDAKEALSTWTALRDLTKERLPIVEGKKGWLPSFHGGLTSDWSPDESAVALLRNCQQSSPTC